jgi:hypothetical protein
MITQRWKLQLQLLRLRMMQIKAEFSHWDCHLAMQFEANHAQTEPTTTRMQYCAFPLNKSYTQAKSKVTHSTDVFMKLIITFQCQMLKA